VANKKIEMKINKIYNENCLDTMSRMEDNFIDLTVTSPPYDNLRTYNGYSFDFENIAKELYRVTKEGGVVVWVVGDATVKGSETGTSFKQALYFIECGFKLHDTMIWNKGGFTAVGALKTRYAQVFEYMFVFVKGKIKTFNPLKDRLNKNQTGTFLKNKRLPDGTMGEVGKYGKRNKYGQRFNIWKLANTDRSKHPAIFPEQLANDHIISWSNENDLIYDPFMGSGTTAKMAILNNRDYIGSEMSLEYCEIIKQRLDKEQNKLF
jgi:site-specific DNA-methyltransferase (adenine-specific)